MSLIEVDELKLSQYKLSQLINRFDWLLSIIVDFIPISNSYFKGGGGRNLINNCEKKNLRHCIDRLLRWTHQHGPKISVRAFRSVWPSSRMKASVSLSRSLIKSFQYQKKISSLISCAISLTGWKKPNPPKTVYYFSHSSIFIVLYHFDPNQSYFFWFLNVIEKKVAVSFDYSPIWMLFGDELYYNEIIFGYWM